MSYGSHIKPPLSVLWLGKCVMKEGRAFKCAHKVSFGINTNTPLFILHTKTFMFLSLPLMLNSNLLLPLFMALLDYCDVLYHMHLSLHLDTVALRFMTNLKALTHHCYSYTRDSAAAFITGTSLSTV